MSKGREHHRREKGSAGRRYQPPPIRRGIQKHSVRCSRTGRCSPQSPAQGGASPPTTHTGHEEVRDVSRNKRIRLKKKKKIVVQTRLSQLGLLLRWHIPWCFILGGSVASSHQKAALTFDPVWDGQINTLCSGDEQNTEAVTVASGSAA